VRRESAQRDLPEARTPEQSARQLNFGPGRLPQRAHRHLHVRAGRGHRRPEENLPVPSFPGKPRQSPGMPVYSFPPSSVARTRKHGVIMGQYSPITQGCPYNWTPTSSPGAETLSITAVACSSGSRRLHRLRLGPGTWALAQKRTPGGLARLPVRTRARRAAGLPDTAAGPGRRDIRSSDAAGDRQARGRPRTARNVACPHVGPRNRSRSPRPGCSIPCA
jgi:hypothetical protein